MRNLTNFRRSIGQTVQRGRFPTRWLDAPQFVSGGSCGQNEGLTFPTNPINGSLGIVIKLQDAKSLYIENNGQTEVYMGLIEWQRKGISATAGK